MNSSRIARAATGPVDCTVRVPGSKSVANRALVCAYLAAGTSVISGVPDGDDTDALVEVLAASGGLHRVGEHEIVTESGHLVDLPVRIDARLAGTTSRFMTAVGALCPHEVVVDGEEPLRRRPMGVLHDALRELGARVEPLAEAGCLPVRVGGRRPVGGLVRMRGNVSSQFISALMLVAPLLEGGLTIEFDGPVVSRSYIGMTERVMEAFGATVHSDESKVTVSPGAYSATDFRVEPDFSSAAVPICAVLVKGGTVRIPGLATSMHQGDARVLEIARVMGARVTFDGDSIMVAREEGSRPRELRMDMSDCSDLVPVVATACTVAEGTSELTGIGFIRAKESDRLGDLAHELRKLGAIVEVLDDGLTIHGVPQLHHGSVSTHHDHRLAMAFSIAALSADSVTISEPGVVSKSWPTFYTDLNGMIHTVNSE